jgi:hypothetical protein
MDTHVGYGMPGWYLVSSKRFSSVWGEAIKHLDVPIFSILFKNAGFILTL